MVELIAPKGLGDAIYLRAIVFYLLGLKEQVTVYTPWPMVFDDLPVTVRSMREMDEAKDLRPVAYSRKGSGPVLDLSLDQFRRGCLRAGFPDFIGLQMFWKVRNKALLKDIRNKAKGRKIFIYQPVKLSNNPYQEVLRPDVKAFNGFVDKHKDYFRIKIGSLAYLAADSAKAPCDLDLIGQTSVHDVFDLASIADAIFCEPCFLVVLAEAMDKPFTCMFARKGLESDMDTVSDITPARIFNKPHLATAVYDG